MTLIEFALTAAVSLGNTSYPVKPLPVWTELIIRHEPLPFLFVVGTVGVRSAPVGLTTWNPKRAQWGVEAGIKVSSLELSAGHLSDHGIEAVDYRAESYNFVRVKLSKQFH